jgi:hypothetical protein
VFARPAEGAAAADVARRHGVAFNGIWLDAPLSVRCARVGARIADASDANAVVAEAQERYDLGAIDWIRLDAQGSLEDTCHRARAILGLEAALTAKTCEHELTQRASA